MKKCRKLLVLLLSIALLVGTAAVGAGALTNEKHWVGSWSAGMTDISVSLLEGKKKHRRAIYFSICKKYDCPHSVDADAWRQ